MKFETQEQSSKRRRRPTFFKVLVGDFLHHLRIPPAFLKNLGNYFHLQYTLINSSSGQSWCVDVKFSGNRLFFWEGWRAFAQDNSLEMGDFLVFKYNGDERFYVHIFTRTGCLKVAKRAHGKGGNARNKLVKTEEAVDVDVHSLGDPKSIRTDATQQSTCRIPGGAGFSGDVKREDAAQAYGLENTGNKFDSGCGFFRVIMRPSYIKSGYLRLPKSLMDYIGARKNMVRLQLSDKRWDIKLNRYAKSLQLGHGWASFVRENHLKVGDTCVFEMVADREPQIVVSILR